MIRGREDKRMIQLERIHGLEKELSLVNEHMEQYGKWYLYDANYFDL